MTDSAENDVPAITHPGPPGPPGPPSHEHEDGSRCMWVRRGSIDRWRQVDRTGWDLGPCPGFPEESDGCQAGCYVDGVKVCDCEEIA